MPASEYDYLGMYGKYEGAIVEFRAPSLRKIAKEMNISLVSAKRAARLNGQMLPKIPVRIYRSPKVKSSSSSESSG